MALNDFIGAGTSLSANFYLRKFYTSNIDARTSSKRSSYKNSELSLADGMALRRAVKSLGSFEYEDSNAENIKNGVRAYISTYNNALSSLAKSSDRTQERNMKQLKALTKEYAKELDKAGITVNDDGTLTCRDSLFKEASLTKFEQLFSKDADYMQRAAAYGKRIERRSDELCLMERNAAAISKKTNNNAISADSANPDVGAGGDSSTNAGDATAAAQIVAERMDLDLLLNTGIGKNVNVSL